VQKERGIPSALIKGGQLVGGVRADLVGTQCWQLKSGPLHGLLLCQAGDGGRKGGGGLIIECGRAACVGGGGGGGLRVVRGGGEMRGDSGGGACIGSSLTAFVTPPCPLPFTSTTAATAARIPMGEGGKEALQLALEDRQVAGRAGAAQSQGNTQPKHDLLDPLPLHHDCTPFPLPPLLPFLPHRLSHVRLHILGSRFQGPPPGSALAALEKKPPELLYDVGGYGD
jgi:hypothetical protein